MRRWDEAGVVKEGKHGKSGDRGMRMMFVGYSHNRTDDCYRMWKKETNRVIESPGII
jgi:hypothetical protein